MINVYSGDEMPLMNMFGSFLDNRTHVNSITSNSPYFDDLV